MQFNSRPAAMQGEGRETMARSMESCNLPACPHSYRSRLFSFWPYIPLLQCSCGRAGLIWLDFDLARLEWREYPGSVGQNHDHNHGTGTVADDLVVASSEGIGIF